MTDLPPIWPQPITITKLEAARRQLNTALELWFDDGDPVAIHTLAYAAYEIIHVLSKKNGRLRALVFDSDIIKDEFRSEWNVLVKKEDNFFKHANNDSIRMLKFNPSLSELFLTFAARGLYYCGEDPTDTERAFLVRLAYERPRFFTDEGRKLYLDRFPVDEIENIRNTPRNAFLIGWRLGMEQLRRQKT